MFSCFCLYFININAAKCLYMYLLFLRSFMINNCLQLLVPYWSNTSNSNITCNMLILENIVSWWAICKNPVSARWACCMSFPCTGVACHHLNFTVPKEKILENIVSHTILFSNELPSSEKVQNYVFFLISHTILYCIQFNSNEWAQMFTNIILFEINYFRFSI